MKTDDLDTPNETTTLEGTEAIKLQIVAHKSILAALLTELKPINFHERAGLSDGDTLTSKHYVIICIEETLETAKKRQWSLCVRDGLVYIYNGAYWKELSKQELLQFLGQAAENLGVDEFEAKY